jgi:class 3 adenylate cyclase/CheY-like chemotaxis protein
MQSIRPLLEMLALARILIVVKDPRLLELLGLQLETANHAVRSVGDPLAVPGLLRDWPADLLLSDMLTVPVEGLSLLDRLRADPAWCDLPAILLTPEPQFAAGLGAGFDQLLIPCKRARLLDAIDQHLSRSSKSGAVTKVARLDSPESAIEAAPESAYNPSSTMMIKAGMDHRRSRSEAPEASSSETRRGTVLFADIRGFTTLSERLFPGEVADLLKNFFDQACQPIFKQGGWVVRFIGDGILALFESAADSPPDDAARALRAASLMVLAARQFNSWLDERLPGRNLPEFAIGVGVHAGDVVISWMGSEESSETTILGDTVNIASRLEEKTKSFGWSIVASRCTVDAAGERFVLGQRQSSVLRGRQTPIEMVEICGLAPRANAVERDLFVYAQITQAILDNADVIRRLYPAPDQPALASERQAAPAGPDTQIDGYRMQSRITVDKAVSFWEATRLSDNRRCVVKLIDFQAVPEHWRRHFVDKHAKVWQIHHPNVVQTLCHGVIDDRAYIVQEHLAGDRLRAHLGQPLSVTQALRHARQLALGLHALHSQEVVHRDLRPENIMLRADGSPVLTNFVMAVGMNGDSAYQSPEQIAGERVDQRSDLFSLGVVLHEMLTGRRPVRTVLAQAGSAAEQLDDFPPLPRAHWRLQPLMDQLLTPRPQQRFASAVELLQALRAELLRHRRPRGL